MRKGKKPKKKKKIPTLPFTVAHRRYPEPIRNSRAVLQLMRSCGKNAGRFNRWNIFMPGFSKVEICVR